MQLVFQNLYLFMLNLFDNDLDKNKFVVKKIEENFDLSPRGIREMLNLINLYMKKLLPMVILVECQKVMVHFHGKKLIKQAFFLNSFC